MRSVLVSGGSRGLGLAIATRLAVTGYRVIALARTETPALCAVRAAHAEVYFRSYDLSDLTGIGALVGRLRQEFGPFYGLVNNAGLGTGGLLTMMRDTDIEGLVRLNTLAPMLLTKYALRGMMRARCGRIVNVTSIVARTGFKALAAYSATKAALEGFTRSLAREVGPLGITVNSVAPGFVDTAMTHGLDEQARERIMRRSALQRMVEPDDVAAAVEYLLSDAAKNITGVTLPVDAGSTA